MRRYESYKDSGIYYIPSIPSTWNVLKGKYLFNLEKRDIRPEDGVVTCFRDGQVTLRTKRRTDGFTNSLKEIGYQGVRKGDLVIHNMDAFAGSIGVSEDDGKMSPVCAICTPKSEEVSQYYYCYLLRSLAYSGFIMSLAKGIRERSTDFRFGEFKELYLPVPSRKEQDDIVSYINSRFCDIDKAIEQQQRMIDLLNERKQIIIQKELLPFINQKGNDDMWFGALRNKWQSIRLKYILAERNERSEFGNEEPLSMSQKYGLIPTSQMDIIPNMAASFVGAKKAYIGDLVFNKLKAHLGVFAVSNYNGLVSPDYAVYYANSKVNLKYLQFLFKNPMMIAEFRRRSSGVGEGLTRLYTKDLFSIYIPLPSLEEQNRLVENIEIVTKQITNHIAFCKNTIKLLQERKRIIINDVVTGKIKVS